MYTAPLKTGHFFFFSSNVIHHKCNIYACSWYLVSTVDKSVATVLIMYPRVSNYYESQRSPGRMLNGISEKIQMISCTHSQFIKLFTKWSPCLTDLVSQTILFCQKWVTEDNFTNHFSLIIKFSNVWWNTIFEFWRHKSPTVRSLCTKIDSDLITRNLTTK